MDKQTLKVIAATAIVVLLLVGSAAAFFLQRNNDSKPRPSSAEQLTHLDIELQDGKPVSPPATYLVKPGTNLEFSIKSNVYGKVGAPTDPPQTITFTQSPLTFHFKASTKPGTYPLSYQADGSKKVIQIGTVVVRSK
jgi:plastocyanin